MNLRALAESDLALTLEDGAFGSATEITFIDPVGNETKVSGWVNDIGFGYDTDGVAVSTRTVCIMWRLSSFVNQAGYIIPSKQGWQCSYKDLSGKEWVCAITRVEPDRTLGVGRAWLSFDLS